MLLFIASAIVALYGATEWEQRDTITQTQTDRQTLPA